VQEPFLRAATKRDMLVRLLGNLKGVYVNVSDHARALAAVERLLILKPTSRGDLRARGLLLARMGRRTEAAEQLRAYLDLAPGAGDADKIRALVEDLRAGRPMEGEEREEL
jgi:regulator of sirC expression with transglutaminase-like and TPR domain